MLCQTISHLREKTKRKRSRLDENAALFRDPNIRFEIKDGRLVVIKHDK